MGFYNFPGIGTVHINEGPVRRVVPQHEKHKWNREPKRGQTAVCVKCGTAKCYRLNYDVVYRRAGETEILTERPACTGQPQPKPSTTLSLDL